MIKYTIKWTKAIVPGAIVNDSHVVGYSYIQQFFSNIYLATIYQLYVHVIGNVVKRLVGKDIL